MKLVRARLERRKHEKLQEENRLLANAEQSSRDVERYLMELEERRSWVAYELRERNRLRLVKQHEINKLRVHLQRELANENDQQSKESGLMSYKGAIVSFQRWQNSPAKNLDLEGHGNAILACKLSKCHRFLFSCSSDKTAKLWDLSIATCIRVYPRHTRKVFDCDIHPRFILDAKEPQLITCAGSRLFLWCTTHDAIVRDVAAHDEVVYKCSFAPEGSQVITCSEDKQLRLWAFPELFLLYVFAAHEAPVSTVRWSPSGRFLVSGSNYKERKLLLWDAAMPKIQRPLQFPTLVLWSPEGLVRRLCMQKMAPEWTFWLTKQEQSRLKGVVMNAMPGELETRVLMDSDSDKSSSDGDDDESEDLEADPFEHPFFAEDIRFVDGARLLVTTLNQVGIVKPATEYIPGSHLVFKLQSGYEPIAEAFITVCVKDAKYDSFAVTSGNRIGHFHPELALHWMDDVEGLEFDEDQEVYRRVEIQPGIHLDKSHQALSFREPALYDEAGNLLEEFNSNSVEVVWACPNAFELGPAVVNVNLKLRGSPKWQVLKYSLRESPIRMIRKTEEDDSSEESSVNIQSIVNAEGERFLFDQSAQHLLLWETIRRKNWEALDSMLDEKCCLFLESGVYKRRWRVSSILRQLYGGVHGLVVPTPIVFSAGCTKSSVVVEATEVPSGMLVATQKPIVVELETFPISEEPLSSSYGGEFLDSAFFGDSIPIDAAAGLPPRDGEVQSEHAPLNEVPADASAADPNPQSPMQSPPSTGAQSRLGRHQSLRASAADKKRVDIQRLHTERPTSRSSRAVRMVTPIPGFRPKTVAQKGRRYDLISIAAANAEEAVKMHELEAYNRNPFVPSTDVLLKENGFGPDIQYFCMDYPRYFPKNAGKAFNALRSRLKLLEKQFEEDERARIPPLASVDLAEGRVVPLTTTLTKKKKMSFINFTAFKDRLQRKPKKQIEFLPPSPEESPMQKSDLRDVPRIAMLSIPLLSPAAPSATVSFPRVTIDEQGVVSGPSGVRPMPPLGEFIATKAAHRDVYMRRRSYYELPGLTPADQERRNMAVKFREAEVVDVVKSHGLLQRFRTESGFEIAHSGAIYDAIFSPSERRVASAGGDKVIRLWDPHEGTFVRTLRGHENEVMSLCYSRDEMFLVSGSADGSIFVWNLLENTIARALRGHGDCVYSIVALPDISIIISGSHDKTIKTWHLNPQRPNAPDAPRAVGTTETSILLSWKAPASFNEAITAFHLQYRVGLRNPWMPDPAYSLPPHYRSKNIEGLVSNTGYYFRIMAENRMGQSDWSEPSKQITTNEGLPSALERPVVWHLTNHSIGIYWYVPNPLLFGSGAREFYIHTVVNGDEHTDEASWKKVTLAIGGAAGKELLQELRLRQEEQALIASGRKLLSLAEHLGTVRLSAEDFELALARGDNENYILMSTEMEGLDCGTAYRFFITARNARGESPPSPMSYTISTKPGLPHKPAPPVVTLAELTSLTFKWDAPYDGGTAILGFRLYSDHLPKNILIKRTQTTIKLDSLLPNTVYHVHIAAYNANGLSELSDPSTTICESKTSAFRPDRPHPLRPIAGSWKSMVLEGLLPYNYLTEISKIKLERRWLRPFNKGIWELSAEYNVPDGISIVDIDTDSIDDNESVTSSIMMEGALAAFSGGRMRKAAANNEAIKLEKKPGARFRLNVDGLLPDTMYEYRFNCTNAAGTSSWSYPSRRAKTNKVRVPQACNPPMIMKIKGQAVTLRIVPPMQTDDSSPILKMHVETKDVIKKNSQHIKSSFDIAFDCKYIIEPLRPGGSYQFRVYGESVQGKGVVSQWSDTAVVPIEKLISADSAANKNS